MLNQMNVLSKKEQQQKELYEAMVELTKIIEGPNPRIARYGARFLRKKLHKASIKLNS